MTEKDTGVIIAMLERFREFRLPRAEALMDKVDRGELLNDSDVEFLRRVFADFQKARSIVDRHPEYNDLVTRAAHLYQEITRKALANQERQG